METVIVLEKPSKFPFIVGIFSSPQDWGIRGIGRIWQLISTILGYILLLVFRLVLTSNCDGENCILILLTEYKVYIQVPGRSPYVEFVYLQGSLHGMNTLCMYLWTYIKLYTQTQSLWYGIVSTNSLACPTWPCAWLVTTPTCTRY